MDALYNAAASMAALIVHLGLTGITGTLLPGADRHVILVSPCFKAYFYSCVRYTSWTSSINVVLTLASMMLSFYVLGGFMKDATLFALRLLTPLTLPPDPNFLYLCICAIIGLPCHCLLPRVPAAVDKLLILH